MVIGGSRRRPAVSEGLAKSEVGIEIVFFGSKCNQLLKTPLTNLPNTSTNRPRFYVKTQLSGQLRVMGMAETGEATAVVDVSGSPPLLDVTETMVKCVVLEFYRNDPGQL